MRRRKTTPNSLLLFCSASLMTAAALLGAVAIVLEKNVTNVQREIAKESVHQTGFRSPALKQDSRAMSRDLLSDRLDYAGVGFRRDSIAGLKVASKSDRADKIAAPKPATTRSGGSQATAPPSPKDSESGTATFPDKANASLGTEQGIAPQLRRDPTTGRMTISSFKPISFAGGSLSCRRLGEFMVRDVNAPRSALQVLAQSKAITVMRICASNGSLVLSCRNGLVTISPRQSRPTDGCQRKPT